MYYKPLYNFFIIKVTTVYSHCQENQKVISDQLKKYLLTPYNGVVTVLRT